MGKRNYYRILKVDKNASPEKIKRAFKKRYKKVRNKQELIDVYETLISPENRSRHDKDNGLASGDGDAKWLDYYKDYSKEQIDKDISFAENVVADFNKSQKTYATLFFLVLAVAFLAGLISSVYYFQSNPEATKQVSTKIQEIIESEEVQEVQTQINEFVDKNIHGKEKKKFVTRELPRLEAFFPAEVKTMKQSDLSPCDEKNLSKLQSFSSSFALFWVARYDCSLLAKNLLHEVEKFRTFQWKDQVIGPKEFAHYYGSDAVISEFLYHKNALDDSKVIEVISKREPVKPLSKEDMQQVQVMRAEIASLEDSIHFHKAQNDCTKERVALAGENLKISYEQYLKCLKREIKKHQEYRKNMGHTDLPG